MMNTFKHFRCLTIIFSLLLLITCCEKQEAVPENEAGFLKSAVKSDLVNKDDRITVFGPAVFKRAEGKPFADVVKVEIEYYEFLEKEYTIVVDNIGASITSAVIKIDGKEVFSPNDFKKNIEIIEKEIVLNSEFDIEVELRGIPDGLLDIRIIGELRSTSLSIDPMNSGSIAFSDPNYPLFGTEICFPNNNTEQTMIVGADLVSNPTSTGYEYLLSVSPAVDLISSIDIQTLDNPVVIRLPIDDNINEESGILYPTYFDTNIGEWIPLETILEINYEEHYVVFETNHLTIFSILLFNFSTEVLELVNSLAVRPMLASFSDEYLTYSCEELQGIRSEFGVSASIHSAWLSSYEDRFSDCFELGRCIYTWGLIESSIQSMIVSSSLATLLGVAEAPVIVALKWPAALITAPCNICLARFSAINPLFFYHLLGFFYSEVGGDLAQRQLDNLNCSNQSSDHFTDPRDGEVYQTVQIGGQVWMAENLKYLPDVSVELSDNIKCYYVQGYYGDILDEAKETENYQEYGALYNYLAAVDVCPAGWHLPSDEEWMQLEEKLGMAQEVIIQELWRGQNEGGMLKEENYIHWNTPNSGATDELGFTAFPGGVISPHSLTPGLYGTTGDAAVFWTSTFPSGNDKVYIRGLSKDRSDIYRHTGLRPEGAASIRCVKD